MNKNLLILKKLRHPTGLFSAASKKVKGITILKAPRSISARGKA
jgi:hypothetical protein